MPRLAMAIAAALVLHILLLMVVVPEPQVEEPEIKGTGVVTVSIIRSSPQSERIEEATERDLPVERDEPQQIPQVIPAEAPPDLPVEQKILEQKSLAKDEQPEEPEKANFDKPKAEQVGPEISQKETSEQNKILSAENETSLFSSDVESLQDPQPLQHSNRPPVYPALARKRGWEGTVILEVDIRSDGMIKSIEIRKSSSYEILDKEALRAVQKWQFQPGSRAGKFVDMKVLVPVQFTLTEQ